MLQTAAEVGHELRSAGGGGFVIVGDSDVVVQSDNVHIGLAWPEIWEDPDRLREYIESLGAHSSLIALGAPEQFAQGLPLADTLVPVALPLPREQLLALVRSQLRAAQMIARMHARGIPIAAGTDTPIFISVPGYSLHSELEHLVRTGLSPMEALESATVRPAEFFSLQDEMGAIEAGMKADLVLLNANPLDEISNTRDIAGVVTKGEYLDIETLRSQTTLNQ